MVNKQVLGRGAREGLGQRTNARLPQARFLGGSVQDAQEGTLSSGGSLEPHCLQKVFTRVRHAGARSTELPGGSPGGVGLPALRQHRQGLVSASLQICTVVSFYLQAGGLGKQVRGGGCQRQRWACSPCPGLLGQVTCQPQGVPA